VPIWRIWRKNRQRIVPGKWLNSLKEEESKHNTTAALREGQSRRPIGSAVKRKTSKTPTDKTDRTPVKISQRLKPVLTKPPRAPGWVSSRPGRPSSVMSACTTRPPAIGTISKRPLRRSGLWVRRDGVRNSTRVAIGGRIGCRRVIWRKSGRATSPPRRASSRITRSRVRSARQGPRA
jgi:hypothetical protein